MFDVKLDRICKHKSFCFNLSW